MTVKNIKYLERLQEIIRLEVGFECKWNSLVHLHEYILKLKENKEPDFRGIPINFAIKYTAPKQPEQNRPVKQRPPMELEFAK